MTSILSDRTTTARALELTVGPLFDQIDNARSLYRADELVSIESDEGPVGFPRMQGADRKVGLLEWLSAIGVWPTAAQTEFMVFQLNAERLSSGGRALAKAELKALQKSWSSAPSGEAEHPSTLVTATLLHPSLRMKSLNTLSFQRVWLTSPYGPMIRASQRMLGLADSVTMDDFLAAYSQWQPESEESPAEFWPKVLWPVGIAEDFDAFGDALTGYLHCLLYKARRWDGLGDRERNGLLLGCHAVSVLLCSTNYLLPFAALHPELKSALNMDATHPETMCDEHGNPTMLLSGAMKLANIVAGPHASGVVPLIAAPLANELDRLFADPARARSELRQFRLSQVATACKRAERYLAPAQSAVPELPAEAASVVQAALSDMAEWRRLSGLDAGAVLPEAVQDYWQRQLVSLSERLPKTGHDALFRDSLRAVTSASMADLQTEAAEAVRTMDAAKLADLAALMESQKANTLSAVGAYVAPVRLTEELHAAVPASAPVAVASADELAAAQQRVAALEKELTHSAELLQLHDDQEANLRDKLAEASNQLRREQARCEALTAQLEGRQVQQQAGPSEALLRALTDELTMADALTTVEELYPYTVVVLPSARESAATCGFQNVRKALSLMLRLCGPYHEALSSGENDDNARTVLGGAYRAQESHTTLGNPKLRSQREFMYNEKSHIFTRHLTLGVRRGDQSCMQVYFDVIDGKMVIAYVGAHLDTSST